MSTYRYGRWEQWDGVKFYSVDKKTIFGWREVSWWHTGDEGYKRMMDVVEQLKNQGHLVL